MVVEDLTLHLFSGLREYFSQTDEVHTVPRIPVMHAMVNTISMKKDQKLQEPDTKTKQTDKILDMVDEESEDDDDYQVPEADLEVNTHPVSIVCQRFCCWSLHNKISLQFMYRKNLPNLTVMLRAQVCFFSNSILVV